MARALHAQGKMEEAKRAYKTSASFNPEQTLAMIAVAEGLVSSGKARHGRVGVCGSLTNRNPQPNTLPPSTRSKISFPRTPGVSRRSSASQLFVRTSLSRPTLQPRLPRNEKWPSSSMNGS
jgi:hypothetical protein